MMKKQDEQRLVPKLRFKGFSEDWEQEKLKDILKVNSGRDYKHLAKGDIPVYGTGGLITRVDDFLSNQPAVGLGRKGTIDKPFFLEPPFWTVDTLFYITSEKNNHINFLFYLLMRIRWKKYDESTGVPSLSKKTIENINAFSPNFEEQIKIYKILEQINDLIYLHKRKSSQLKLLKKVMIKNTMTLTSIYPMLRFSDFIHEWETSKIKDSFKERKDRSAEGRLLSVTIDDGVIPTSSLDRIVNTSEDKSSYKSVYKNDLVYNSMRMWQGASGKSKLDGIVSPAYTVVTPIGDTLTDYFSYYFKRNDLIYKFRTHSQGLTSDTWTLRYLPFSEIKIRKPKTIEEQLKIFIFIKSIDDMILINNNKISLLNDTKKVYLDKLFI